MLKTICNRCDKDLGITTAQARPAGVSVLPVFYFDERKKVLKQVAEIDLCEPCAREYVKAETQWLPNLERVSVQMNQGADPARQPT